MLFINVYEAKSKLSQLINEVNNNNQKVVICKNGKPVIDLVPHKSLNDPFIVDEELQGAEYLSDPCEGIGEDDWPLELR